MWKYDGILLYINNQPFTKKNTSPVFLIVVDKIILNLT
jgi:hypothetical protein